MASLKTIQKRKEKALQELEKTEQELREKEEEIQLGLGEEIIKVLELDYDDLDLVKDRKAMAEKIKEHLNSNFFQENKENSSEENEMPNEPEYESQKEIQTEPQFNH